MIALEVLKTLDIGKRVAEEEKSNFSEYFIFTQHWNKIKNGRVDIVFGPKGSGKSAIYLNLLNDKDFFAKNDILLIEAENLRGTPAFKQFNDEFYEDIKRLNFKMLGDNTDIIDKAIILDKKIMNVWKLCFALIITQKLSLSNFKDVHFNKVYSYFEESKLVPKEKSLRQLIKSAISYIKKILNPENIELGAELDPELGYIKKITGKIKISEPTIEESENGFISITNILEELNKSLKINKKKVWIMLDRLDVAFEDNLSLEKYAIKSLFRTYLDFKAFESIKLKIFIRDDIWRKIIKEGFRENSHLVSALTLKWSKEQLLNLVIKRIISNSTILNYYDLKESDVINDFDLQVDLFHRIFSSELGVGNNKSSTFDWIYGQLKDGNDIVTPRELIHFINNSKDNQIEFLSMGMSDLIEPNIISAKSIIRSIKEVSDAKFNYTITAEYPYLISFMTVFINQNKSNFSLVDLEEYWELTQKDCIPVANALIEIGIFINRVNRRNPIYEISNIYKNAFDLSQ